MLGPAPSASGEPSIWYADVAVPQRKSRGNSIRRSRASIDDDARGQLVEAQLHAVPRYAPAVDPRVTGRRGDARPREGESAGRRCVTGHLQQHARSLAPERVAHAPV